MEQSALYDWSLIEMFTQEFAEVSEAELYSYVHPINILNQTRIMAIIYIRLFRPRYRTDPLRPTSDTKPSCVPPPST